MTKLSDLKVGQRVLVNSDYYQIKNEIGIIIEIVPKRKPPVAVRFNKYSRYKHSCRRLCEYGHGWYVNPKSLTLRLPYKRIIRGLLKNNK